MTSQAIDWGAMEKERNSRLLAYQQERAKRNPIYYAYLSGTHVMKGQCQNAIRNSIRGVIKDARNITETEATIVLLLQDLIKQVGEIIPGDPYPEELPTYEDVIESMKKEEKDA